MERLGNNPAPAPPGQRPVATERAEAVESACRASGFVLLIGEDEAVRDSLAALLQAHGFGVLAAGKAEDLALPAAASPPLCVVLDPDRDGMAEAAVIAEARRRFPELPLIAITHGLAPRGRETVPPAGVELLRKPLKPERLLGRLAELRCGMSGGLRDFP
jgi:DNA-binding NtrC family response regulator